jgi:mannosylglycerate hydrolase
LDCIVVSHTHWDREWYRTYQRMRARLVDVIDRVLELLEADPDYRFVLDGQSIVLEDYLEIRPGRRDALAAAGAAGRVSVGPWYVQPDSLLPSGEAHVRNLLEGRRVAEQVMPAASRVAYTPDSFGHPAQFPQLFAGFGLDGFTYWRGDDQITDALGPVWRWRAPDGSEVTAVNLVGGYGPAADATGDVAATVGRLIRYAEHGPGAGGRVLLMNGSDHLPPDPVIGTVVAQLAERTGWTVRRGLLEDFLDGLAVPPGRVHQGELLGAMTANLLPGVWSTHLPVKLTNRAAETELTSWAEPWAALGLVAGAPDERAGLRAAWRELLANHAHDSLGACSADAVVAQVHARLADVSDFAAATTARLLERIAGLPVDRVVPWSESLDLAVFNPSPHPRTDVVRFPVDAYPLYGAHAEGVDLHPMALSSLLHPGFTVDGSPARVVPDDDPSRVRMLTMQQPVDVEFVVADVPAFGWRRVRLEPGGDAADEVDEGRSIGNGLLSLSVAEDGTFELRAGDQVWTGLGGIVDEGDRGDTYDFEPVDVDPGIRGCEVEVERRRHPSGIEVLIVTRVLDVPAGLADDRTRPGDPSVSLTVQLEARVCPDVGRVDLEVRVDNTARDHRLRLCFPSGAPVETFAAASTFDVATRTTTPVDDAGWKQRAPRTFPHQGWIALNGLTVVAAGLPEAEVTSTGDLLVTVVRAVGWLSREDLASRPEPAGPGLPTPSAQCPGPIRARLALVPGGSPRAAADAEAGLRAVVAGPAPLVEPGGSLLAIEPATVVLSACKPAEDGDGFVLRLLNPSDEPVSARARFGFELGSAVSVRLDETGDGGPVQLDGAELGVKVGPHALRSVRVRSSFG